MVCASATIPDFTGKTIENGHLRLLEVIGTGAYGVVYKALDTTTVGHKLRHYAVKCLTKDLPTKQRRFQAREIALHCVASDHPSVLTMHGIVEDAHYLHIVLDLCPGGDLFAAITERHVYYRNTALLKDAFVQLLDAVQWCHDKGIFHRDLKPENILCSADGSRLYLSDFGLATKDRISRDFGCGSSYYMSPECIGKEFDLGAYSTQYSDIWSIGIILANMITGRNPWRWATTDDECFCSYLHNRDFLLHMLPISKSSNTILRSIFHLNPRSRTSIHDLRQAVLKTESFWMSEADVARASAHVKIADAAYAEKVPTAELAALRVVMDSTLDNADEETRDEDDSEYSLESFGSLHDHGVIARPKPNARRVSAPPGAPIARVGQISSASAELIKQTRGAFSIGSAESDEEEDSASSGEDSDGPITPETHANDPAMEVPDLPEGLGLGELVISPDTIPSPVVKHHKSPTPAQLLRNAVQRFKAL